MGDLPPSASLIPSCGCDPALWLAIFLGALGMAVVVIFVAWWLRRT